LASTVVVSSLDVLLASSVAAVLASTASKAVPSAPENPASTCATFSLLLVKSVNTCRLEPMVATATRSEPLICSSTHFCADSTAFCTSSGCMELVSKSSVSRRCPATSSCESGTGVSAVAGALLGTVIGMPPDATGVDPAAAAENIAALSTG